MATDFTNNNTTISTSGAFQPNTKNTPLDIRTRVNLKADIDSIPNPFVGMKIIVLQDETNDNQMTEYVVVSLKANSIGAANSKVNEVVLAKDFLGVSGNGISEEQTQQLNTAYTHSQSTHIQQSDIPTKTSQLQNDSNFISSIPEEYVTEQELNAKRLATETFVTNKIAEASIGGGNSSYTLPTASNTVLGGIKVGEGLGIDTNGVLSVNGVGESISAFVEGVPGNNLITSDNRVTSFIGQNGATVNGTFTNYIKIQKGMCYVSNVNYTQYHFFDTNKNFVSTLTQVSNPVIFSYNQDGYLLIKLGSEPNPIVLQGTDIDAIKTPKTMLQSNKIQPLSKWYGKRWLCIGDSITTDESQLADNGYAKLVSRDLGMTVMNVAVSGKTMSYYYDLIDGYPNDFDLITVMLGTNNHGYNCAIGSLNDDVYKAGTYDSNNSFYAQTQLMYEKLRLKYPKSVIMFLTPIKRTQTGDNARNNGDGYMLNGVSATTKEYRDAVIDVCNWYSIPCIDLFNSIDPRTETNRELYFMNVDDGTHPNDLGHALFIAPIVRDAIEKHAPYFFNDWNTAETYGNIVTNVSELSINEGASNTFNVTLDKTPTNEQIINIVSNNTDVTVSPTTLTFSADNYNVAQTVTVNASEDVDTTNDTATITLSNSKVVSKTVSVTVIDNDRPAEVTTYAITNNLTNVTNSNNTSTVNEGASYTATLSANSGYVLDTVIITMNGTDVTSTVYSNGTINIASVTGNIVITANAIVESGGSTEPTDLKTLVYDFTKLNAGATSISSTGTEVFDITLTSGEGDVMDGYLNSEVVNKTENYNPTAVDFLNNSDFTIVSKYKCGNAGVYPYILCTCYNKTQNGYNAYISKGVTSMIGLDMAAAPTNGFYQERYLRVEEYFHDTEDHTVSYYPNGVSDKNITIPYDTNEHTVAITYNNTSKQIKVYVDGVYKDYIDLSGLLNPITWTGLSFGKASMQYYNLYISNQCGTDDETISLMNSVFAK